MLESQDGCLVIVDVQGKLADVMTDKESLIKNVCILIQAARLLDIPILWCQQAPEALGPTVSDIASLLIDNEPIDKACFSCYRAETFRAELNKLDRKQVLLCGIETHVCIYQTALDLLSEDFAPTVITDAVSSRTVANKETALTRLSAEGVAIACTEMVLFEWLKTAEHPQFKAIARLIK